MVFKANYAFWHNYYFQLTTFFTTKCTVNFIIKVLGTAVAFTIFLMKYVLFRMHMETVSC